MKKERRCPNCGTPIANEAMHGVSFIAASGVVTYKGRTCHLTPAQIDILEVLLDAYPRAIPVWAIGAELNPESEGDSRNSVAVHVSDMRRRFHKAGLELTIVSRKGRGDRSGYALALGEQAEWKIA